MITMQEIDEKRAAFTQAREAYKNARAVLGEQAPETLDLAYRSECREREVIAALAQFHRQASYHDHDRDAGALLGLLAYVDEVIARAAGAEPDVLLPWALRVNLTTSAAAIRRCLEGDES